MFFYLRNSADARKRRGRRKRMKTKIKKIKVIKYFKNKTHLWEEKENGWRWCKLCKLCSNYVNPNEKGCSYIGSQIIIKNSDGNVEIISSGKIEKSTYNYKEVIYQNNNFKKNCLFCLFSLSYALAENGCDIDLSKMPAELRRDKVDIIEDIIEDLVKNAINQTSDKKFDKKTLHNKYNKIELIDILIKAAVSTTKKKIPSHTHIK